MYPIYLEFRSCRMAMSNVCGILHLPINGFQGYNLKYATLDWLV